MLSKAQEDKFDVSTTPQKITWRKRRRKSTKERKRKKKKGKVHSVAWLDPYRRDIANVA